MKTLSLCVLICFPFLPSYLLFTNKFLLLLADFSIIFLGHFLIDFQELFPYYGNQFFLVIISVFAFLFESIYGIFFAEHKLMPSGLYKSSFIGLFSNTPKLLS